MTLNLIAKSAMIVAGASGITLGVLKAQRPMQAGDLQPKRLTDATWYEIRNTQFKLGKQAEAMKIINEHMAPARLAAGLPPTIRYEHATGPWDLTTIFPIPEGPSALEWEISPDYSKLMKSLAAQCGSEERAKQIREEYLACIQNRESHLVFLRNVTTALAK